MKVVRAITFATTSAVPYVLVGLLGDWRDLAALAVYMAIIATVLYGMFFAMEPPHNLRDVLRLAWDVYSSIYCIFGVFVCVVVWKGTPEEDK